MSVEDAIAKYRRFSSESEGHRFNRRRLGASVHDVKHWECHSANPIGCVTEVTISF